MNAFLITISVLAPFGWVIYRLLRYTARTIGDESPLVIVVSYKIEDWAYFTRFDFLVLVFLTLVCLFMIYVTLFIGISSATAYWHWLIGLGYLAGSFYGLWYAVFIFKLNWQYWLITRGKTVTLDPNDKSLEIATAEETIRFTAADVQEIEQHTSGISSSKMVAGYSYLIFSLKDGRAVYLNLTKSYLEFALDEYFKTVPTQRIPHKIPWIKAV